MTKRPHEGLRHVSASPATLSLIMDDGESVHLNQDGMVRMLAEVANAAPGMLIEALEQRIISRIVRALEEQ